MLDNYGNGGHQNFARTMPFDKLSGIMTAAEVAEKKASGALIETEDGTGFYIAEKPTTPEGEYFTRPRAFHPTEAPGEKGAEDRPPLGETIAAMRQTLKAGVQVVTAPQLFPTPPTLPRAWSSWPTFSQAKRY